MPVEIVLDPLVALALLPAMIEPARTAFLIIDVQEDFISPAGAAGHWGIDLSVFEQPLQRIERLIDAAHAAGVTTVFVRVITRDTTDSVALKNLHARKGRPPASLAICRADTQGAAYYRIKPRAEDWQVEKPLYSSFAGTDLDSRLRSAGIDTLVVAGFTTDCCVDCTVRDAFHLDYNVFIVSDACAAYEESLHLGGLDALSKNCALLTESNAVIEAWL